MSDYEKIKPPHSPCAPKKIRGEKKRKCNDRDDLSGMLLNMSSKIDIRELFILWLAFLFTHTSTFADHFLKKFKGMTNPGDDTMTFKGVFGASLFMLMIIIICRILF